MVRFPDGMRDELKKQAQKSGRSLNSEIIHRLSNSLGQPNFADMSLSFLNEELNFELMNASSLSGRSLQDEVIFRLKASLESGASIVNELSHRTYMLNRKYEDALNLLMQLTPEERRLLEERSEIAEMAKRLKISSKDIGKFVRLNPIGNRGRISLRIPKSDYTPIFGDIPDDIALSDIAHELKDTSDE